MDLASVQDYKLLWTCAQYVNEDKSERLKIYNKFVHLLTCGQFKKIVHTGIDKLLQPSTFFFQDKIKEG